MRLGSRSIIQLFNDLIRPRQQRRRDCEAEGLGGLEIDDEIELGGLLDRQATRLAAFENLVDVLRRSTQLILVASPDYS
jgi:hypothetical protein